MRTAKYGVGVRKAVDSIRELRAQKYACPRCKKLTIKRTAAGLWKCKHCGLEIADGAFSFTTKVI